jgi:hypothetical protein
MHNLLAALCLVVGLTGVGHAQQGQDSPEFPKYAASDSEVILFVSDLMPHLQAVIKSPQMDWFLTKSQMGRQMGMTPGIANTGLIGVSTYIPTEIAFSTTDRTSAELAELARLGLLWGLCSSALEEGNDAGRTALDGFHKQMATSVARLKLQDIDLWLNFRTPAAPNQLFRQIKALAEGYESEGIDVLTSRKEIKMDIRLSEAVPSDFWGAFLVELGVARFGNKNLEEVAAALSALKFQMTLTRAKSGLHLRFGPVRENAGALDLSKLRLWQFDKSTVFYSSWRNEKFAAVLRETRELWDQWADKPIGKTLVQFDEDDMLGDLLASARYFEDTQEGALRVDVRDGDLYVEKEEISAKPVPTLADSAVLKFVPKDCDTITVDTTRSLANHAADYLDQIEERLANREFQYELTGRDAKQAMTATVSRFYYDELKGARKMLKQDSFDVFTAPAAVLLDTKGQGTLNVTLDHEGEQQRIQVLDMPVLEYAVVSGIKDRKAAEKFLPGLFSEVLSSLQGAATMVGTERFEISDGYTAVGLGNNWQQEIPNEVRFNMGPEYRPHSLIVDDGGSSFFVFSTSIPLTTRIIAQLKSGKPGLAVGANQIAAGTIKGSTFNRSLDMLMHMMFEPDAVVTEGNAAAAFMSGMAIAGQQLSIFRDFQELIAQLAEFRWETTQSGNVQTTKARTVIRSSAL